MANLVAESAAKYFLAKKTYNRECEKQEDIEEPSLLIPLERIENLMHISAVRPEDMSSEDWRDLSNYARIKEKEDWHKFELARLLRRLYEEYMRVDNRELADRISEEGRKYSIYRNSAKRHELVLSRKQHAQAKKEKKGKKE